MTSQRDPDTVNLRLILVSGKTQDFTFSPNDSATEIARHVFENWPAGMNYNYNFSFGCICSLSSVFLFNTLFLF
uniref:Ubiquitin-like 3b n=1 Tax=Sinocyclocheilus grahami TaxID=75366 RepID=A0A672NN80_SINGR